MNAATWLYANYLVSSKRSNLRIGWTVPTYVGTAVIRNKFKRWIREYLRANFTKNSDIRCDVNFVFKKKSPDFYKQLSHKEFNETLGVFFKKFNKTYYSHIR